MTFYPFCLDFSICETYFLLLQIYDRRLKQYRSSLEDIDAALIQGVNKRFKRQDGAEVIKIELDELNRQYISLVQWTKDRLREITRRLSEANVNIQVGTVSR